MTIIMETTEARATAPFVCPPEHLHGKFNTCYRVHDCRCRPCKDRSARMKAAERARIKAGRHQNMRAPEKTLAHLKMLLASTMNQRDIARASGLNEATIHRLLNDDPQMVFPQTERAILAVTPAAAPRRAPRAWAPAWGTARRIQALMALGYSGVQIGAMVGRGNEWATRLLNDGSGRVEERTRQSLYAAYDRYSMTRPEGVYADRTRKWAASRGYFPPLAWDDIDDVFEEPDIDGEAVEGDVDVAVVAAAVAGEKPRLTPAERREVVTVLNARGSWSASRIAAWVGCSAKTVERIRDELGLPIPELANIINDTTRRAA